MSGTTDYFGAAYGQVTVGGSPTPIVNGLTIAQYLNVYNPSTNSASIFLGDANVTIATGFVLEKGAAAIALDTGNSRSRWYAVTAGSTQVLTYIARSSDSAGG